MLDKIEKDSECCTCLEVKSILYLSRFMTAYGYGECMECSDCRMSWVYDKNDLVTPMYIWDHNERVRRKNERP